ncbi:hypothetical protein OO012_19065 [Rhodobacteraceae bacterium KMM 6894]|nr:hypothetical protein [Rhodobacteraceae bacterium KMM 6894]
MNSVTIGDRTFVYAAGSDDDGISGFEVMADGQLFGRCHVNSTKG